MFFRDKLLELKKRLGFLKKREEQVNSYQQDDIEPVHEFEITIEKIGDIIKLNISDFLTMSEYFERVNEIDKNDVTSLLSNAVIWNGSKQRVYKGDYYIFRYNGRLYNIRNSEDSIQIDERTPMEDGHIWEKILSYKISEGKYAYSSFKHDETGNTYYTMYYDASGVLIKGLELSREEFLSQIGSVMESLSEFPNILDIVDLGLLKSAINDGVTLVKR